MWAWGETPCRPCAPPCGQSPTISLWKKGKDFMAYSLAVDESTDTSDTAQLSVSSGELTQACVYVKTLQSMAQVWGKISLNRCLDMLIKWSWRGINLWDWRQIACDVRSKEWIDGENQKKCRRKTSQVSWPLINASYTKNPGVAKPWNWNVMSAITQVVNFIRAKGLNHRRFISFLAEFTIW